MSIVKELKNGEGFFCPFFACTKKEPKKHTPSQGLASSAASRATQQNWRSQNSRLFSNVREIRQQTLKQLFAPPSFALRCSAYSKGVWFSS
jgi:hypothetical protein